MYKFPKECTCFIARGESIFNISYDDLVVLDKSCPYADNCSFIGEWKEIFEKLGATGNEKQ